MTSRTPTGSPFGEDGQLRDERQGSVEGLVEGKISRVAPSPTQEHPGSAQPLTQKVGGFAPGTYECRCYACGATFTGDKRAISCEACALAAMIERPQEFEKYPRLAHWIEKLASRRIDCFSHASWCAFLDELNTALSSAAGQDLNRAVGDGSTHKATSSDPSTPIGEAQT